MSEEPPITRLFLLRHGPVAAARDGLYPDADGAADLSDTPALQFAASCLPADARWWSSPHLRARQTADALVALADPAAQISINERLQEQNFGDWFGLDFSELWPRIKDLPAHNWSYLAAATAPPGGDSYLDLAARIEAFIAGLIDREAGKTHVIICHAGVIRAAAGLALGLAPDLSLALGVEPLSVSHLLHRRGAGAGGDWQLAYLNRRAPVAQM